MYNGKPSCINTKETCSKEGEQKISSCNSNTNKETIKTCIKSDDGKLFYKQIDSQPCFNGCNDDNSACKAEICPLSEPLEKCRNSGGTTTYIDRFVCKDNANGERVWQLESSEKTDGTCDAKGNFIPKEECSTNDFEAECDGNISVTCSAKVVKRANCEASVTPKVCAVIDNKPGCYAEKDECTAPGTQIVSGCLTNLGKERVVICQKASNGKSYWVFSKNQDCANGCNAAGTACAE